MSGDEKEKHLCYHNIEPLDAARMTSLLEEENVGFSKTNASMAEPTQERPVDLANSALLTERNPYHKHFCPGLIHRSWRRLQ